MNSPNRTIRDSEGYTPTCWVVTDGKSGTENQCIGLAEATEFTMTVKRIKVRSLWKYAPPLIGKLLLGRSVTRGLGAGSDQLTPPWPDLLIAGGRASVPYALAIRRLASGSTFAVQILNPRIPTGFFDLVVAPAHDHLQGDNVITTRGALNLVTPKRLEEAKVKFASNLARLPHPLVAVLIGGASRNHRFSINSFEKLGLQLAALSRKTGAGLAVTLSRRTGLAGTNIIRESVAECPHVLWDGNGSNPYFGYLALADAIIVTSDSISMTSEACTTGLPVFVAEIEGGSPKFFEFHNGLKRDGFTRRFDGTIEEWTPPRFEETITVATEIKERMGL